MLLKKVRIQDYRPVHDSGWFDIEPAKTLLVGVNEAGKTAILRSLQTINPPADADKLDPLRDYPRSRYTEVQSGRRNPKYVEVATATFALTDADRAAVRAVTPSMGEVTELTLTRYLDNHRTFTLSGVNRASTYGQISKDVTRLRAHLAARPGSEEVVAAVPALVADLSDSTLLVDERAASFDAWLSLAIPLIDEDNEKEEERLDRLRSAIRVHADYLQAGNLLIGRSPLFVYYSNYFTVRPRIHLAAFAAREASGELDLNYDFGNQCLLKLLGFTARELADLASGAPSDTREYSQTQEDHEAALTAYHKRLDDRQYRLNAASVFLTTAVREVWGDENVTLRLTVDGQYLKVMVVDDLGVEVELDQRSEGFRWLVSFFVVFKAQAGDELSNAILLLDEPGLSLHALKQQEFRKTVTRLGVDNQIIYTTHSPFMVGTDELDLVRIVEMKDRQSGTKVHTRLAVDDPRSIYPLQAALGYELAQSLFAQPRNLVCEGVTDLLYVEGLNTLFIDAGLKHLRDGTALVPAHSASKVLYYCTILTSQRLKVAALLDSDTAGEKAAAQEELVQLLRPRDILRTKDFYKGSVSGPEVEDLLRETLGGIAKDDLGWDSISTLTAQPNRRTVDILKAEHSEFSKYRLARAFLRWLGTHSAADLTDGEREAIEALFGAASKALA